MMKEFKEYKEEKDKLAEDNKSKEETMAGVLNDMLNAPVLHVVNPKAKEDIWVVSEGTTGFEQLRLAIQKRLAEAKKLAESNDIPLFAELRETREGDNGYIEYLTEAENFEVDRWVKICEEEHEGNPMDEGFLGKLVGGIAGFLVGPTIGRVVARALGIEKGILHDMFTSRIVSAALGVAIAKHFGGEYKE